MARMPGSPGAHSGRKRQPSRAERRHLDRGTAPRRRAACPTAQPSATCAGPKPSAHRARRPHDRDHVEHRRRQRPAMPKRSCALSIPMATAAKETRGRNGSMTRVRRTVSSVLPGTLSKPGRQRRATSGRAKTSPSSDQRRQHHRQQRQQPARPAGGRAPRPSLPARGRRSGTKAADSAPSANRSRSRLGMRKATWNASA